MLVAQTSPPAALAAAKSRTARTFIPETAGAIDVMSVAASTNACVFGATDRARKGL
jgi:hypothetical protein